MNLQHKLVSYGERIFTVQKEVYEPAEDTFLLAGNLSVSIGERVLDMGAGCGILGILAAERASEVVAVDINPHAVIATKKNAKINGVAAKITVILGDLFLPIAEKERFDLVVFNAPYLPVDLDDGESWSERAWCGGKDGRAVIDRFIIQAPKHVSERGRILMLQSTLSDVKKTLEALSEQEFHATIVDEMKLDFERIVVVKATKKLSNSSKA
jgi:release factor glutamine methyltransferase